MESVESEKNIKKKSQLPDIEGTVILPTPNISQVLQPRCIFVYEPRCIFA